MPCIAFTGDAVELLFYGEEHGWLWGCHYCRCDPLKRLPNGVLTKGVCWGKSSPGCTVSETRWYSRDDPLRKVVLKTGLKLNPKKLYGADGYAVKAWILAIGCWHWQCFCRAYLCEFMIQHVGAETDFDFRRMVETVRQWHTHTAFCSFCSCLRRIQNWCGIWSGVKKGWPT